MTEVGRVEVAIVGNVQGLAASLKTVQGKLLAFGGWVRQREGELRQLGMIAMAAGGAISAAMIIAVRGATEFEAEMRNVNSILKASDTALRDLGKSALNLAGKTGQAPAVLARGLYDIASSGFEGAAALKVLEASAVAATAGISDTATASRAITAVLNAYGLSAEKATWVSDILFKTVERGVITFPELAQQIGDVISTAAQAKIPLEEVGAAIATLTRAGVQPAEAVTSLNQVLLSFIRPSDEAKKLAKALGIELSATALASTGLSGVMADLGQALGTTVTELDAATAAGKSEAEVMEEVARNAGTTTERLAELFPNVRALRGALVLAAGGGRAFAGDVTLMANATGAAAAAFEEQSKAFARVWDKLKASLQALAIEVGDTFLPMLTKSTASLRDHVQALREWREGHVGVSGAITKVIAAIGAFLFGAGGITMLLIWLARAKEAFTALGIAASTAGTIIATIKFGAVAAAVWLLIYAIQQLRKDFDQSAQAARGAEQAYIDAFEAGRLKKPPPKVGKLTLAEESLLPFARVTPKRMRSEAQQRLIEKADRIIAQRKALEEFRPELAPGYKPPPGPPKIPPAPPTRRPPAPGEGKGAAEKPPTREEAAQAWLERVRLEIAAADAIAEQVKWERTLQDTLARIAADEKFSLEFRLRAQGELKDMREEDARRQKEFAEGMTAAFAQMWENAIQTDERRRQTLGELLAQQYEIAATDEMRTKAAAALKGYLADELRLAEAVAARTAEGDQEHSLALLRIYDIKNQIVALTSAEYERTHQIVQNWDAVLAKLGNLRDALIGAQRAVAAEGSLAASMIGARKPQAPTTEVQIKPSAYGLTTEPTAEDVAMRERLLTVQYELAQGTEREARARAELIGHLQGQLAYWERMEGYSRTEGERAEALERQVEIRRRLESMQVREVSLWDRLKATAQAALDSIRQGFEDSLFQIIRYGGNLKDFWQSLWDTFLKLAIHALVQWVIEEWAAAAKVRAARASAGGAGGGGKKEWWEYIPDILPFLQRGGSVRKGQPTVVGERRRELFVPETAGYILPDAQAAFQRFAEIALAGAGALGGNVGGGVTIGPGAVVINAQTLDERTVRDAGALLADEVNRRLGWTDRRAGV